MIEAAGLKRVISPQKVEKILKFIVSTILESTRLYTLQGLEAHGMILVAAVHGRPSAPYISFLIAVQ